MKILLTLLTLLALTACNKQSATSGGDSTSSPAAAVPFNGEIYQTLDQKEVITLVSSDELEHKKGEFNLVCKYSKQGDTLRVVENKLGTTQAIYYKIISQGLRKTDGTILYSPAARQNIVRNTGTAFFIRIQPSEDPLTGEKLPLTQQSFTEAVKILRSRAAGLNDTATVVTPSGEDRIIVHIPGVSMESLDDVRRRLQQVGKLDIRIVHPESGSLLTAINARQAILDPAWTVLPIIEDRNSATAEQKLIVHRVPDITGDRIKSVVAEHDTSGWFVNLQFDTQASDRFTALTKNMKAGQDRLAIVLDNRILSAPTVQMLGSIAAGRCNITGNFSEQEARTIESAIAFPLKNPAKIEEERFMDLGALK